MHTLPMRFSRLAALGALCAMMLLLAACASVTPYEGPIVTEVPLDDLDLLDDAPIEITDESYLFDEADPEALSDADLLAKRVIYFDYDSSLLSELGDAISRRHADYLSERIDAQVILEGHADERGTREYNLALAEDRAKTVSDVLQALGVDGARIHVVSYGEERPAALGHDETSWSQNRRVNIVYQ
ncbi:MAG: peptidoglycan-associated lipoprotein Pal [Gammaproteobacteria bacterium]